MFGKDPARLVEKAVKGMLPKNKLGAALFRNLKVYVGLNTDKKHKNQEPLILTLKSNGSNTQNR